MVENKADEVSKSLVVIVNESFNRVKKIASMFNCEFNFKTFKFGEVTTEIDLNLDKLDFSQKNTNWVKLIEKFNGVNNFGRKSLNIIISDGRINDCKEMLEKLMVKSENIFNLLLIVDKKENSIVEMKCVRFEDRGVKVDYYLESLPFL